MAVSYTHLLIKNEIKKSPPRVGGDFFACTDDIVPVQSPKTYVLLCVFQIPIDWLNAVCLEKCVAFGEMTAAKKTIVCGQWRWMRTFEYQMLWCGDQAFLGTGIAAPKQEYNGFFACVELFDYMVGKGLSLIHI